MVSIPYLILPNGECIRDSPLCQLHIAGLTWAHSVAGLS